MSVRNFALIIGIVMLTMGCLALVPTLNNGIETLPVLYVNDNYGLFLNLFPMNIFNKIILIIFGIAGMSCYFIGERSYISSIFFSKITFWFFGVLALFGLFPSTNTLSGYIPLYAHAVFAHAFFSLLGGYFAYLSAREDVQQQHRKNGHHHRRLHKV